MISIQIKGLDQLQGKFEEASSTLERELKYAMVESVNAIKNTAQDLAPYDTGTLRRSIFTDVSDDGFHGEVAQDSDIASYGVMMEYGTAPHDIYPVTAKALFWDGALYPVKVVHHPGTAAQPFMEPALEQNADRIQDFFNEAIEKVIQSLS